MASIEEILNDSDRHLEQLTRDAGWQSSIPSGPVAAEKLADLACFASWWLPGQDEILPDPVEHLQAALDDITLGKRRRGANLARLADHSNLQDILTLILLALSYMRSAVLEFGPEVGAFDEKGKPVRSGYLIDLFTFDEAQALLVEIEEHLSKTPADARLPLVFAITALLERCSIPCRDSVGEISEHQYIELRWGEDDPSILVFHARA